MRNSVYDYIYQLYDNEDYIDYDIWVLTKSNKIVLYGNANILFVCIGTFFKNVEVLKFQVNEDVQYIDIIIDL